MELANISSGLKSFICDNKTFFIATKFDGSACTVTITDGVTCWKSGLGQDELQCFAKETQMSSDEYVLKMKTALQEEVLLDNKAGVSKFPKCVLKKLTEMKQFKPKETKYRLRNNVAL